MRVLINHESGDQIRSGLRLRRGSLRPTLARLKTDVIDREVASEGPAVPASKAPVLRQSRYIIGNAGCERFSFYGMHNTLTVFLPTLLLSYPPGPRRASAAKDRNRWAPRN